LLFAENLGHHPLTLMAVAMFAVVTVAALTEHLANAYKI
jgi:hypothetical protein|tara:strand:+ start:365 stop:481 length:117 start_codon:yes stop_codon:yes gene_type:complete